MRRDGRGGIIRIVSEFIEVKGEVNGKEEEVMKCFVFLYLFF